MSRPGVNQAMLPTGIRGRLFARIMEWLNTPTYRRAVALINPHPDDTILEIGFGTGALLTMLAPHLRGGMLAGVDPSPLMVRRARRRLARFAATVRLDLRLGSDQHLDWPEESFSHVAALHSFQFWHDPVKTLRSIKHSLRPDGQLTLILRSHAKRAPQWLPNPVSRTPEEVTATLDALGSSGYGSITRHPNVGSSVVLTARAPT